MFNSVMLVRTKLHPISSCLAGHQSMVTYLRARKIDASKGSPEQKIHIKRRKSPTLLLSSVPGLPQSTAGLDTSILHGLKDLLCVY